MRARLCTPVALALGVALAACGNQQTQTVTNADGSKSTVTTTQDGGNITIKSEGADGKGTMVIGGDAQWPADAPALFQAYPGAAVTTSISGMQADGASTMVTFTSADPADKVMAFYQSKLEAAGLEARSVMDIEGTKVFSGKTKDGFAFSIMVQTADGATTGSVSYGKEATR